MSLRAMTHVWGTNTSQGASRLMLLAIADHTADDTGESFPGINRLATKCNNNERGAQRLINGLEEIGEIFVDVNAGIETTHGYTNRYYFLSYMRDVLGMDISDLEARRQQKLADKTSESPGDGVAKVPPHAKTPPGGESTTPGVVKVPPHGVAKTPPKPSEEPSGKPSDKNHHHQTPRVQKTPEPATIPQADDDLPLAMTEEVHAIFKNNLTLARSLIDDRGESLLIAWCQYVLSRDDIPNPVGYVRSVVARGEQPPAMNGRSIPIVTTADSHNQRDYHVGKYAKFINFGDDDEKIVGQQRRSHINPPIQPTARVTAQCQAAWTTTCQRMERILDRSTFDTVIRAATLADYDPATKTFIVVLGNLQAYSKRYQIHFNTIYHVLIDACGDPKADVRFLTRADWLVRAQPALTTPVVGAHRHKRSGAPTLTAGAQ